MKSNKNLKTAIICLLCAASAVMTACGSGKSSSVQDSSSAATAAPSVTLPSDSQINESESDSSSQTDDSKGSDITPLMWEVTSSDGTKITMMGSMHALKDEVYPLPDKITEAYENADVLAVECDTTTVSTNFTVQLKQLENMYYEDGTTIKDHLPPDVYDGIVDYVEAYGIDIKNFETFRLWALSSQMETLALQHSDLNYNNGIDYYFLDKAHDDEKEIYEVESVDFQIDMLINMSDEIYAAMLSSYNAETKDDMIKLLEDTYQAWIKGDYDFFADSNDIDVAVKQAEEAGEPLTEKQIELISDYNKQLLFDRNITMKNSVEELLKGDKDVFYVVGAAHFAGEGGIIDLLEKDGYTVTKLEY